MTFEEMNRAFEFMIQHGADLDARLAKLEKLHENHHDVIAELVLARERMDKKIEIDSRRLDQDSRRIDQQHRDLTALIEINSKHLARLEEEDREIKARLDKSMQELRESLNRLFEKLS